MYVALTTISIPFTEYSVKNVDLKYMCLDLNVDLSLDCKGQHRYFWFCVPHPSPPISFILNTVILIIIVDFQLNGIFCIIHNTERHITTRMYRGYEELNTFRLSTTEVALVMKWWKPSKSHNNIIYLCTCTCTIVCLLVCLFVS